MIRDWYNTTKTALACLFGGVSASWLACSLSLLMILLAYGQARAQDYAWAKRLGGMSIDIANSITTDASGNVYTVGRFADMVDFDPGAGTAYLTSVGSSAFLSKLDASGNFVWAKAIGGYDGTDVAIDVSGNIYITGQFSGTIDFDPGTGIANLTALGNNDIYISKLDASGNFVWAKRIGAVGSPSFISELANAIAVDASGNVYTTGFFQGTVDFDPGVGVANLTETGGYDIFINKLDTSGNFVWAKRIGPPTECNNWGKDIAIDASGNIYVTGTFSGIADFDPGTGVTLLNPTSGGGFVVKLDSSSNFVWAKNMVEYTESIAIDASSNVHITGFFYGTQDFDPSPNTSYLTSAGNSDIFVAKLNASGNFVWARRMGGTSPERGAGVALDATGNVYTTGYFEGTADFNPGAGVANLISGGMADIFVSKLDASGNFVWAKSMGSSDWDESRSIAVDGVGNAYTTGRFNGTVDFDPSVGIANLTSMSITEDAFISKLSPLPDINLQGNGQNVVLGSILPTTTNHTDFGTVSINNSLVRTFTIQNVGAAPLNVNSIDNSNTTDFTVGGLALPATVNAGGSVTFTITINASTIGIKNATITINNNDVDEASYDFAIRGNAVAPEINLKQNTISIASTGSYDFGAFTVNQSSGNIIFTIENTGNAVLNLTGNPKLVKSGTNASDFTITETLPATVNANSSATFTINFTPSGTGTRTAQISIANNDSDENPYIVNLTGVGNIPIIAVKGNGNAINNGSTTPSATNHTNFANWTLNTPITRTFTIENTGSASLNITGVTLTGADASAFSITQQPATTVAVGQNTTFTISHTPTQSVAVRNATVNIANNSAVSPFTFAIRGSDIALSVVPRLSVGKVEVYPNPAKNTLTISLEGNPATEIAVTLLDAQGKSCLQRVLLVEAGKAHLRLQGIASGLHLLHMQVGKEWIAEKIMVER